MTRTTKDSGDAAFPEGERLHAAFAEEIDRPGLEGPSFDAVRRSGTARLRRRRATVGATFAVASVAAVATAVLATGGASHGVNSADSGANTTPAAAGTTPSAPTVSTTTQTPPPAPTTPTTPLHPADAVLISGTADGHNWRLVRQFTIDQQLNAPNAPAPPGSLWCGNLNIIVDGVQTNSGNGNSPCLDLAKPQVPTPALSDPGFTSIVILDPHHTRLGTIVAGAVNPQTASVTALCGSKSFTVKPNQPAGDTVAYYAFDFPNGSGCQLGTLSFFNASGTRTAYLPGMLFEGGK
jgi:hypothetical protein